MKKIIKALDHYYQVQATRYRFESFNRSKLNGESFVRPTHFDADKDINKEHVITLLHHQIFQLLSSPNTELYQRIKSTLFTQITQLPRIEAHFILTYLLNHIAQLTRENEEKGSYEMMSLYQFAFDNELFVSDKKMKTTRFLNVVNTACIRKEYDYLEQFIDVYADFTNDPEHLKMLAWANVAIAKEEYREAIELLAQFPKATDPLLEIRLRIFRMVAWFEQKIGEEFLLHYCDSFYHYLRRSSDLSPFHVKSAQHFIRFVKAYLNNIIKKDKLIQLTQVQPIFMQTWVKRTAQSYKEL